MKRYTYSNFTDECVAMEIRLVTTRGREMEDKRSLVLEERDPQEWCSIWSNRRKGSPKRRGTERGQTFSSNNNSTTPWLETWIMRGEMENYHVISWCPRSFGTAINSLSIRCDPLITFIHFVSLVLVEISSSHRSACSLLSLVHSVSVSCPPSREFWMNHRINQMKSVNRRASLFAKNMSVVFIFPGTFL